MPDRPVAIVADSTLDIPAALALERGITVVPLDVHFGDETLLDGVEISSAAFLDRLATSPELPRTSQPPPARFEDAFRAATAAGNDVLCVTVSAELSGTGNSARLAAEAFDPGRVRVVDSRSVSIGGGFIAIAAARAAREGASLAELVALAESMPARTSLYAALDTLEYLQKGGRIGRASALLGSLLSIKPIVQVRDGQVQPVERVRTWRRALDRLGMLAEEQAPFACAGVMHTANRPDAERLAERIAPLVPSGEIVFGELGPVVATYGGPGLVGFVVVTPA